MPYPIGTPVTVTSVNHLGRYRRPTHLIGRTGTVIDHTADGHAVVTGLDLLGHRIQRVFADEHLIPAA